MSNLFKDDIKVFCDKLVTPGTTANTIATEVGGVSQDKIKTEVDGFQKCIEKLCEGQISYAEMRARYG